jgi:predicted ATP-grasp superfamily ATP-dependent carboligase
VSGGGAVPAVVVGAGWAAGLSAIRSLGRAGIPVVAVDDRPSAIGFHSRYAQRAVSPERFSDHERFARFLAGIAGRIGRPVPIFPMHDEDVNTIARFSELLGDRFLRPFPDWPVLEPLQDKRHQLAAAAAARVPAPRTAREPTDAFGYPVLVKPFHSPEFRRRFGVQAFRCDTRGELDAAWAQAAGFEPLVQELIPGGDDTLYSLGCYLARDGRPLGLFCGRKLRQTPPGVGTCRVGESVWVDEVVDQGLALLRQLGYHGAAQVEFKRDPRDGAFKLIEVNPRLWQWHGLAAACGVDLTLIAYRHLLGQRVEPVRMDGRRRRWAITFMRGERPAWVRPPYTDPFLARDDPRVAASHLARVLR